jgi:phosphatidylserine decarboxylase
VLAVIAVGLGFVWWPLALVVAPVLVFLFAFFRDPHREIPAEQAAVVSPADGTVSDITDIDNDPILDGPAVRIGIFSASSTFTSTAAPATGKWWIFDTSTASSSMP